MTEQHPITPPPELVKQWRSQWMAADGGTDPYQNIATRASRWGWEQRGAVNEAELQKARDEELEACVEWLGDAPVVYNENVELHPGSYLRRARRPKPPSLKEQALGQLDSLHADLKMHGLGTNTDTIRRALELLPND